MVSSLIFLRSSSSLGGSSVALSRSCFPSGEKRNPLTPPLCVVTAQASPPSALIIHTCRSPSFSRSLRNASRLPSGDHSGAPALLSPRVYCRGVPPAVGTTHTWVTFFHSLSFSIFVSVTV